MRRTELVLLGLWLETEHVLETSQKYLSIANRGRSVARLAELVSCNQFISGARLDHVHLSVVIDEVHETVNKYR